MYILQQLLSAFTIYTIIKQVQPANFSSYPLEFPARDPYISILSFLEFGQQRIIQQITVQHGIAEWQGSGGWLEEISGLWFMGRKTRRF